ncbi:alpha-glucosidase [Streptomyces abyssalis]|uniref:Alpha-glucosidase n=1 Tax=Streptomyces abyssalis TaxID=933944 RepID=A0A1E7JKL1_9ACTN|nr:glycoside hydrolase family 13 protein [Streptomyces abyssalis]OEU88162.1 alpha-glucosidase [Streptomyces abyssalis]OEU91033.1 alpha-glucosidase [Streptomyces abyssalis]
MTQHLAHAGTPAPADAAAHRRKDGWWRDAVIYQVYPRSFADGDGDGMGDLAGVRSRLPYLARLGVDAVWLSPFYASPQADGGYDVTDYRAVDPRFGELSDAAALIEDAHGLGLRVIVDIVPNHSSDRHEWFRRALEDGPGSPARGRYHFRPGKGGDGGLPPNDWESVFGGPAWTRVKEPDGTPGEWYLHLFAPEQPDFNWEHPAVHDEFRTVLRFWLDLGVDGFRVDVAHGLVKAEGLPDTGRTGQLRLLGNARLPFFDQDGVHEIYRDWRRVLEEYPGERIGVAEAWAPSSGRTALYVREDELHQAFNFHYLQTGWDAEALRAVVSESLEAMRPVAAPATWVLSNHDVVRHRTRLGGGLPRARAAALLMLALPGSAYVYQGEELGLPEVTELPDEARQDPSFFRDNGQEGLRDGCRVPLPWERRGSSFGFGDDGSWLPQPEDWGELSVAAQTGSPGSTLELYRTALRLRREHPGLGAGESVEWLPAPEGVIAFRRDGFVCAANTGAEPAELAGLPVAPGELMLASGQYEGTGPLPADTTAWWSTGDGTRAATAAGGTGAGA